jgi:transcriptional regulator with XRE-family HTH domain
MESIGAQLRAARGRLKLTLREVEERSNTLAQQWGHSGYRISHSWLDRIERENRGLSATKLIVLAFIYNLTMDQMLALCPGATDSTAQLEQVTSPNATLLLADGPLEEHAKLWLPDRLVTDPAPDATMLLARDQGILPTHLRRGVIGQKDHTMEPMIPSGSLVLIDTQKRAIGGRKEWMNDFDRPVYFLFTRLGYHCGFCELDKREQWLRLVPHMLSRDPQEDGEKRWRYRKEVEVIGTVAWSFIRRMAYA